jgi:sarcosine oxidase subunit gamma
VTADALTPSGPLDAWAGRFAALPADIRITAEPFVAMAGVRVDPAGAPALGLPTAPSTWVVRGDGRAIRLGPDEWLVTSPSQRPPELAAELAGRASGSVVDVSGQWTTLRLRGGPVRAVLATGCALDLHPRTFPAGSAAQTLLGLAGVVLLALDDAGTAFEVLVRPSYARYLADWLLDATAELAPPP